MIDIEPYLHKLEVLKEFLAYKIDRMVVLPFRIDISCLPNLPWEEVVRIWEQTGVLFCPSTDPSEPISFEQYYQSKHPQ